MGLFSFQDTHGSPPSHPQIDQSLLWVYLWLEWIQPATEVAGEERRKKSRAQLRLRPCKWSRVTRVQPLTPLDRGMDGLISAA